MLPLLIAGGITAGAGLIGAAASGSLSKGRQPNRDAYNFNYKPTYDWTQAQADYMAQQQAQQGLQGAAAQAGLDATGAAPSLAQQQLQAGQARAAADAAQTAANARGGPAAVAMAQRQAQAQQVEGQAQVANAAAQLRAQEYEAARQRELAALGAAGGMAGAMRQGSQGQVFGEQDRNIQAARYDQEGAMAYDQGAVAADEAQRRRKGQFWGKLIDSGTGIATMGVKPTGAGG